MSEFTTKAGPGVFPNIYTLVATKLYNNVDEGVRYL